MLRDLEKLGYVGRRAGPEDARATVLKFTDERWRFLEDAYHVRREVRAGDAAILGEELLDHEEKVGASGASATLRGLRQPRQPLPLCVGGDARDGRDRLG